MVDADQIHDAIVDLDDSELVFVLLGLLMEHEAGGEWGRTELARVTARCAFFEIAERWIPRPALEEALRVVAEEDPGPSLQLVAD
jgi:hypothetical protein